MHPQLSRTDCHVPKAHPTPHKSMLPKASNLFHHAHVLHIKGELEDAARYCARATGLVADFTPTRWGWAQCQIAMGEYEGAVENLKLVIEKSPQAMEAYTVLGLLQIQLLNTYDRKQALANLKKATELDPINVEWVLLQVLVYQTNKAEYSLALERYLKVVEMMESQHSKAQLKVYRCLFAIFVSSLLQMDNARSAVPYGTVST